MSEIHTYAGELDDTGTCLRCIVGTAAWAEANLGGTWQDSPTKVGIGWTWSEADGWRPPQPSPDCVWDDTTGAWDCPPDPDPDPGP